jgi:hypothetical protein
MRRNKLKEREREIESENEREVAIMDGCFFSKCIDAQGQIIYFLTAGGRFSQGNQERSTNITSILILIHVVLIHVTV